MQGEDDTELKQLGQPMRKSKAARVADGRQDGEDEQAGHGDLQRALECERIPAAQAVGEVCGQAKHPGRADGCAFT